MSDELLQEPLLPDPPSRKWWVIPLATALFVFLAGVGFGLFVFNRDAPPETGVISELTKSRTLSSLKAAGSTETPSGPTPEKSGEQAAPEASGAEGGPSPSPAIEGNTPSVPDLPATPSPGGEPPQVGPEGLPPAGEISSQPPPATGDHDDADIPVQYEESLPHEETTSTIPPSRPAPRGGPPRVAIVIDDLGYNGPVSLAIARLAEPVTLAILPNGQFSRQVATIGKATGKEVILHQPMEPKGYPRIRPGPGAMLNGMGAEQILQILQTNLQQFPEAVGINNHMGSRLTENRQAMDAVMEGLKERKLFFLDSRTSQTSVGHARALAHGVPSARRDVFLDNVQKVSAIDARLAELEHIAVQTGRAVGIGHPYRETLQALQRWLPEATKRGVRVESISHFLHPESAASAAPAASPAPREGANEKPATTTGTNAKPQAAKPPAPARTTHAPPPPRPVLPRIPHPPTEQPKAMQPPPGPSPVPNTLPEPIWLPPNIPVESSSSDPATPNPAPVLHDLKEHVLPVDQSP